jgi:hypothetical protein
MNSTSFTPVRKLAHGAMPALGNQRSRLQVACDLMSVDFIEVDNAATDYEPFRRARALA